MNKKVLVGMSGGVDSSVAAALLVAQGYDVHGVTMKIWSGTPIESPARKHACYGPGEEEDIRDAALVAEKLKIPFTVIGLEQEYHSCVISYFKDEYLRGRTPNPCVRCNHQVKFGHLLEKAREQGLQFDYFATGHYVRKYQDPLTGRWGLKKALDLSKDQSYFLVFLTQQQLEKSLFPLGEMRKSEVKTLAQSLNLPVTAKPESQDFIDSGDYGTLFDEPLKGGPILDLEGNKLGEHRGIVHYTVGQRKGLGISAKEPLYVLRIDREKNAIIVGPDTGLYHSALTASALNWIAFEGLSQAREVRARIRLAHKEAPALVEPAGNDTVMIRFHESQRGATPGQAVVMYENETVLGGGIIDEVLEEPRV